MSRADQKTVKIRCGSWDQVEAFYAEKVLAARGNILVVKMPFRPGIGEAMTVALGLPDGLVFAIDGTVMKIGADDAGRVPVALRLHGLTPEVRSQLKRLVAQSRGITTSTPGSGMRAVGTRPPVRPVQRAVIETVPPASDPTLREVLEEERPVFDALAATRERLAMLPARQLLGVAEGATPEDLRVAYLTLAMRVHPDRFRRYRSPALPLLANEVFVLVRRAYERLSTSLAAAPPEMPDDGWIVVMPDAAEAAAAPPLVDGAGDGTGVPSDALPATGSAPYSELSISTGPAPSSPGYDDDVSFTTSVRMRALTAEELFEEEPTQALATTPTAPTVQAAPVPPAAPPAGEPPNLEAVGRAALVEGRHRDACEAFAGFLRRDPRNRQVRALYHVASGLDLRAKGEGVKARLQFETALAHDKDCEEARRALMPEPRDRDKSGLFRRLFDK